MSDAVLVAAAEGRCYYTIRSMILSDWMPFLFTRFLDSHCNYRLASPMRQGVQACLGSRHI